MQGRDVQDRDKQNPYQIATAVRVRVAASGSSFYRAMRLLPRARRAGLYALYAFCREVDDIADAAGDPVARVAGLMRWRREIEALYRGQPLDFLVARALAPAIGAFDLPRAEFDAILDGMMMDARQPIQAPDQAELDLYCDRVAGAVGRLSVRVFGCAMVEADCMATAMGRALQLTNILRDLAEDAARGRLYLPRELLRAHGIEGHDPDRVLACKALPAVCQSLALRTRQQFDEAWRALTLCPRAPMRPARLMLATYGKILERLEQRGWQDLSQAVRLSSGSAFWLWLRYGLL